jgi:hypothetical protein
MKTKTRLGALFAVALLAAAPYAQAITYDITSDHATGGLGTAPFGTVTLLQSGANVNFTVDLANGFTFVQTGAADNLYFKFNGTGITAADIVNETGATGMEGFAGAFNGDGTGTFGFGIGVPNGPGNEPLDAIITFSVLNATIAELTVPNALGIIFVADILSAQTGNTGPADVTVPGVPTPDGGTTSTLIGLGLLGLALMRRCAARVA